MGVVGKDIVELEWVEGSERDGGVDRVGVFNGRDGRRIRDVGGNDCVWVGV